MVVSFEAQTRTNEEEIIVPQPSFLTFFPEITRKLKNPI